MHLKSIEINGFKSFASKITFEFPHGITGIVGPNGSGKSNVGDAVRWVLGEQSARQLRGSRMEDVIFSGTESRKPLGFAYVAIVFDNTDRRISLDYDEVKVARRVYRSGESEYLINGSACRRKDIIEIFYDTGIGKEGYSIIGQGQVEKILSGKIEDSRELFDEAAGIAKYKKNRSVTEKSLEREHQNLERVTDILNELGQRAEPLKRQSETARKYLSLKEKEKNLDIHLFLYDYDSITKEQKQLKKQQDIVSEDLSGARKAAGIIKEKNDILTERTKTLTRQADELEEKKALLLEGAKKREGRHADILHQKDSNQLIVSHYEEQERQESSEWKEKQELVRQRREETAALEGELERQKEEFLDGEDALRLLTKRREKLLAQASGERARILSLMSSHADTKEKMSRYAAMEEQLLIRNSECDSRLLAFRSELEQYQNTAGHIRRELEKAQKQAKEAEQALKTLEEKTGNGIRFIQEHRARMDKTQKELLGAQSRLETLRGISERHDGYQQPIRRIMEQQKKYPGIIGVVADILTLDQKYETAIEIALGGALQNIVTEDDATARVMIEYLKKNRYGRATFLPLTNIRKKNIAVSPRILLEEGVIGMASGLVSVEQRFEDLVVSLLGKTVVVDHVEHALNLARKNHFSLRIVTLGGELLNPGGAITGGVFRHSGNLLGRKREIDECRLRTEELESIFVSMNRSLAVLEEEQKQRDMDREEAKQERDRFQLSIHDLSRQLQEFDEKERGKKAEIRMILDSQKALREQLDDIRSQKTELARSQVANEKIHEENNDMVRQIELQIEEAERNIREQEEEKNNLTLEISKKEQQMEYFSSEIHRLTQEMEHLEQSRADNQKKRKELICQNKLLDEEDAAVLAEITSLRSQIRTEEGRAEDLKASQKLLTEEHNSIFQEMQATNERLLVLEKENARIAGRLEKLEADLESGTNDMWENYELTYHNALSLKQYEISSSQIGKYRAEKKDISQRIRQLGHVNVGAIEEYQEVGERYEFMKGQYDDICQAEEKLSNMIDDLNAAMREQFLSRFQDIRQMFHKVFGELFEGGKADLELMDEGNILECGIRIVAQPPGKKLQNILLLSGGERALTAIALLFAIQQLKPSPFCLLDEIEAALDDNNINRFSKYLKRLSRETQFIIITHRRGTMAAADSLYGITMQEKGISTLISVNLIDKQLDT